MSALRAMQRDDETDDSPPPYTPHPTDELTLELGPSRPFRSPPQLPPRRNGQHSRALSDFAQDFYAAGDSRSRSTESLPLHPPPRHPPPPNLIPDDGRPTRTPVPGHPLLNNGRTLVYPADYECRKCPSIFPLKFPTEYYNTYQVTIPDTKRMTLPTPAANAGKNIPNLIQDPLSIRLGAPVRPIDRDLY